MVKSIHSQRHKKLSQLLREARKAEEITQSELASRLGRPQSFVAKYEAGERRLDVIEFLAVTGAIGINPMPIIEAILTARGESFVKKSRS